MITGGEARQNEKCGRGDGDIKTVMREQSKQTQRNNRARQTSTLGNGGILTERSLL